MSEEGAQRGNGTPRFILARRKDHLHRHRQRWLEDEDVAQDRGSDRNEGLSAKRPVPKSCPSLASYAAVHRSGRNKGARPFSTMIAFAVLFIRRLGATGPRPPQRRHRLARTIAPILPQ